MTTAGFGLPKNIYMRRRFGERGHLAVVPSTLAVSAVFVLLSLTVHLNPGLIYGIVAGFAFQRELAGHEDGRPDRECGALHAFGLPGRLVRYDRASPVWPPSRTPASWC